MASRDTDRAAVRATLAGAYRREWAAVFGTIVRLTGDWSLAEDCAQDAFARAIPAWERDGVPNNPGAWLVTTARHRALDMVRRRQTERTKLDQVASDVELDDAHDEPPVGEDATLGDERLRLVFTCCHPALPMEGRVALTLRAVMGLTTAEIARLFLVSEATVSQRMLRAKRKIADAGIPYRVPLPHERSDRVRGVLAVVYLMFTEAHTPSGGSTVRDDLAEESIRLARLLVAEYPDDVDARALLALFLLQHARRAARLDGHGDLVPLEEQDRRRWDRAAIEEGATLARSALRQGDSPYALQAALAAQHSVAPSADSTDWTLIVHLYDRLLDLGPSPVAQLGRAVAAGMRDGPDAGLAALDEAEVDAASVDTVVFAAARADLLRRAGRWTDAASAYRDAVGMARNDAERRYFERRRAECSHTDDR